MKIVNSTDMAALEREEFKAFGDHLAEVFMDRVGMALAASIEQFCSEKSSNGSLVYVLAGKGNNGGDAYHCAKVLMSLGYRVIAVEVTDQGSLSPLCRLKREDFLRSGGRLDVFDGQESPFKRQPLLIVDGLFGTGFNGQLKGLYRELVLAANNCEAPIFAIDIPSGISGDLGFFDGQDCIHASKTYFLELPKLGYFLGQAWNHMGLLHRISFGLSELAHEKAFASASLLNASGIKRSLPKLERQRHKYQAGLLHIWAGSMGMEGAAALVCRAALRSGCGLVKLAIEAKNYPGFSNLDLEVVKVLMNRSAGLCSKENIQFLSEHFNRGDACIIGPGLSLDMDIYAVLHELAPSLKKPLVLDADALTIFAQNAFSLPEQTVMTPHIGELKRLLRWEGAFDLNLKSIQLCQQYVENHQVTLVVKGAPTFIFHPKTEPKVMPRGHPGMASAGTGDVLAGIIGSFLAQGLEALDAACIATYLHGLGGELAAKELGAYSLIASDIIDKLPNAFAYLDDF